MTRITSNFAFKQIPIQFKLFFGGRSSLVLLGLLLLGGCSGPTVRQSASSMQRDHVVIDSSKRGELVMTAMSLLNTPYRYGGDTPAEGFDCSGLVAYVIDRVANERVPRNTSGLARAVRPVNKNSLQEGDLVFFNTLNQPHSHVGIYVGDGLFINAPSSGGRVRLNSLSSHYFAQRFDGAGTFFN